MPKIPVLDVNGKQVEDIELSDSVFGVPVNKAVIHEAVVMHLANQRRGTAATKTRGMVAGGGRKPWRQKGTGRARQGSIRSPLWRGGGTVFGPAPREYSYHIPKKMARLALKAALSAKVESGEFTIVDSFRMDEPKTQDMAGILQKLKAQENALLVIAGDDQNVRLSARNLPGVTAVPVDGLNVYDVLSHRRLIMTKDAVARVEEALAR